MGRTRIEGEEDGAALLLGDKPNSLENGGDIFFERLRDPSELHGIVNEKTALFTDTADPTQTQCV
jgi:hypothetical protein